MKRSPLQFFDPSATGGSDPRKAGLGFGDVKVE